MTGLMSSPFSPRVSLIVVGFAATLFGTEGLLRRPLLDDMSVSSIVLAEHLLLALFAIPVVIASRHALRGLTRSHWLLLGIIGVGASGGAALLFTQAIAAGNPTTASLLQNTQPLFVIFLALMLLRERVSRVYWPCLVITVIGAYLLSFGTSNSVAALGWGEVTAAGYALAAAALWAAGTVLARRLLDELSFVTLTALRITFALPFLWIVAFTQGEAGGALSGIAASPLRIGASALVPGLLAMLLFYRGLRESKACHAVLAEFMYPTAALIGNWLVLGTFISPLQGLGCLLLVASILIVTWRPSPAPAPALVPTPLQTEAGPAL